MPYYSLIRTLGLVGWDITSTERGNRLVTELPLDYELIPYVLAGDHVKMHYSNCFGGLLLAPP